MDYSDYLIKGVLAVSGFTAASYFLPAQGFAIMLGAQFFGSMAAMYLYDSYYMGKNIGTGSLSYYGIVTAEALAAVYIGRYIGLTGVVSGVEEIIAPMSISVFFADSASAALGIFLGQYIMLPVMSS